MHLCGDAASLSVDATIKLPLDLRSTFQLLAFYLARPIQEHPVVPMDAFGFSLYHTTQEISYTTLANTFHLSYPL